jgi:hypothetical protein
VRRLAKKIGIALLYAAILGVMLYVALFRFLRSCGQFVR